MAQLSNARSGESNSIIENINILLNIIGYFLHGDNCKKKFQVNAGGVSEQNVSLTFDQPQVLIS